MIESSETTQEIRVRLLSEDDKAKIGFVWRHSYDDGMSPNPQWQQFKVVRLHYSFGCRYVIQVRETDHAWEIVKSPNYLIAVFAEILVERLLNNAR